MTYCVGLRLTKGLVMMSDTRTNAGVDNISTFRKMHSWTIPGERAIMIMSAGNLATTQAVISLLDERTKGPEDRQPSILREPSMFRVASLVGETLRKVIAGHSVAGQQADSSFHATLIVAGQISPGEPTMFMIYPEGNFIEASQDTPFFQIGETKYGRPILVRAYDPEMSFEDAMKLLLLSFDSTIKANLSVDLPLDYCIYSSDSYSLETGGRIAADDPYYREISEGWGDALRQAFHGLPPYMFPEEFD
ncbi:proteasome-type protease [Litoreibacter roseus]|uniref:Peptidase n=1 Tax=Litoreibacter roseus TaxID=2601869 RepID=A0A6N6JJX7_9RHOB|nr:proteasome-type protease [Litoreibacter roseus]GFE66345.1 peptidase [Litoreibacter roseus]